MIKKKIELNIEIDLHKNGLFVVFDNQEEQFVSWEDLIKHQNDILISHFKGGEQKFGRVDFYEFDQIAEGLIDAGAEIKKILAESKIHD